MYSATQSQRNNSTGYWMTCSWSTSLQGMLNTTHKEFKYYVQLHVHSPTKGERKESGEGREAGI